MRKSTIAALVGVPIFVVAAFWLMRRGYLEVTAYLLGFTLLLLIVMAALEFFRGKKKWALVLVVVAAVIGGTVGGYGWNLNEKFDNIARAKDDALNKGKRPSDETPTDTNIMLMGTDSQEKQAQQKIEKELTKGTWQPGMFNSDSLMLVHIPANRKSAYVVSIPRDSYVSLYDAEGGEKSEAKINAAFSLYGPFGSWRTVENLTGLRIDHMAIVDFNGFRDLTKAVGGVRVYVPKTVYDSSQKRGWDKGWHKIQGEDALQYVRQRHGLPNGDFDRVARQQNFLRALMKQTMAQDTLGNPVRLQKTLDSLTKSLTVDESWTNGNIRGLVLSMRKLKAADVQFITVPLDRFERVKGQAVNIIDEPKAKQLWSAITDNTVSQFVKENPKLALKAPQEVR